MKAEEDRDLQADPGPHHARNLDSDRDPHPGLKPHSGPNRPVMILSETSMDPSAMLRHR